MHAKSILCNMSGNNKKTIAFNYFGGKFTWTEYLYANFPVRFTHLVDLFAGSMVVSLNYHGNVIRTANEINGEITNFFTQLRDHEEELVRALRLTPYSEVEFDNSWVAEDAEISDLEKGLTIAGWQKMQRSPIWKRLVDSTFACVNPSSDWARSVKRKAGTWRNSRSGHRLARVCPAGKMPSKSCMK